MSTFTSNSKEAIYVEGENPVPGSKLIRVGEFIPSSALINDPFRSNPPEKCKVFVFPGGYNGPGVEEKGNKAWASEVVHRWEHFSFFYSDNAKDIVEDLIEELKTLQTIVKEYVEQVTYPEHLELPESVHLTEKRLAKNRAILPYMLAGDTVETTDMLLFHDVKANSDAAACLRAGVITLEQVEEYKTYPKHWLEELYSDIEPKPFSFNDFFGRSR